MLKDKDLDKLFKSKFEGTSFEPDASSMEAAERMVEMTSSGELDQLFRDNFAAVNPAPPAESVAHMEKLLAGQKGFSWGRFGIAAGVILLFLSAGLWYFMQPNSIEQPVSGEEYAVPESNTNGVEAAQPFENSSSSEDVALEEVQSENSSDSETYSNENSEVGTDASSSDSRAANSGNNTNYNTDNQAVANGSADRSEENASETAQADSPENTSDAYASSGDEADQRIEETESPIAGNNGVVPPVEHDGSENGESANDPSGENAQPIALTESQNENDSNGNAEEMTSDETAESEVSGSNEANTSVEADEESAPAENAEEVALDDTNTDDEIEIREGSAASPKAPGFDNRRGYNNYFGLMAGLSIAPSFDPGNAKNPVSTNVIFGLRYAYQIRPELTLNVNALYSDRTGINQTKAIHDTIYHFGMATRSHYITPTRLHYIETPIYISWQMDRNHSLSLGVSPAVLIGQNNRLDLVSQDSFDNMDYHTETHTGRSEGILHYDASVMMGYTYRVNEYWSVGVRGQYGLFDVTNDNYYHSPKTHRNIFIRFMAEYKLPF